LRIMSDALPPLICDTLLGLLGVSAAFNCVDHDAVLQRLEKHCGLKGQVPRWMLSFLTL